jgi:hypothetical protein
MKSGFYDRAVSVSSYTDIRLSCKFLLVAGAGLRVIFVFFAGEKMELSGSGLRPVRNGRDSRKYRIQTACKCCRMEFFVLLWI